ncbi:MAG: carbohydrate ABC transporter permease [Angelakisella sp.]
MSGKIITPWYIIKRILFYGALVLGSIIFAYPLIFMFFGVFKKLPEFYYFPPKLLPDQFILDNFIKLFDQYKFGMYYVNSIKVAVFQVVGNLVIALTAGYGFAKFNFKFKNFLFMCLLMTTMVPWVATIIPLYIMSFKAGMVDTFAGLALIGMAGAFDIFLVRNFMSSVPDSLLESARIDGAGEFKIFFRIALPLCKPILAVLVIHKFLGSWNAFQWPLLIVDSDRLKTIPLIIATFSSQYYDAYDLKMAACAITIIPVLLIYICLQKYFVKGISFSGIKG